MNKQFRILGLLLFFCIFLSIASYYPTYKKTQETIARRERLAELIKVSLDEYPDFPYDYFSSTLKPGMSIEEVHKVVIGYEKVFKSVDASYHCEIYFFLSSREDLATRMKITYTDDYKFARMNYDDGTDSLTIRLGTLPEGLLTR